MFMSILMNDFWETHPDFADRLGAAIKEAHIKIKEAVLNGNFEFLKHDIIKAKQKREKEVIDSVKNYREIISDEIYNSYPEYVKDFIEAYSQSFYANVKYLPIKYLQEYYDIVATELPQEITESWTKALKNEPLSEQDELNIKKIGKMESPRTAKISRALEATLSDILYHCTENPEVYILSHADCKMAIKQIMDGREAITIYSHKLNEEFYIPILNRNIDTKEVDRLYEKYLKPLPSDSSELIIEQFIDFNYDKIKDLKEKNKIKDYLKYYIEEYCSSNNIIFGNNDTHSPETKSFFAMKFIKNLPDDLDLDLFKLRVLTINDFKREEQLHKISNLMRKKYNFLPAEAFNIYTYELKKILRNSSQNEIDQFENVCCKPRKTETDPSKIILMNREGFNPTNKVFTLCIEQALADLIYENCKNEDVYAFQMEELLSYYEAIMLIKKFPMKEASELPCSNLGKPIGILLKHRIQPYQIEKRFKEYYDEILNYIYECIKEKKPLSQEDILFILNPDENKTRTDELTLKRIKNTIPNQLYGV